MLFNLVLGVPGASGPTVWNMMMMKSMLPASAQWSLTHTGMKDMSLLLAAVAAGAKLVRVGFEDSLMITPTKRASSSAELVARLVDLLKRLGRRPATPGEARGILHLM